MKKSLAAVILAIEKDNPEIFEYSYRGISAWGLIRYGVFAELERKQTAGKALVAGGNAASKPFKEKVKTLLYALTIYNPLFYLSRKEILIFRCTRKSYINEKWIDIYTAHLETMFDKEKVGIYETQMDYKLIQGRTPSNSLIIEFASFFSKLFHRFVKPDQSVQKIKSILRQYQVDIDIDQLFKKKYLDFKVSYSIYSLLFAIRKPRRIFLVNYIDKAALLYAAKNKGIETSEMQHGFTSPSLLLYHYPNVAKNSLRYFPDQYYFIEPDYICGCEIPLTADKLIKTESPFFAPKPIPLGQQRNENSILFVSQDIIHHEFFSFVKTFAKAASEKGSALKIYYKPHPREYPLFNMEEVNKIVKDYGLVFLKKEQSITQYINEANYVAGVFSTALLEARTAGANIILMDLPGVEHFGAIKEKYDLPLVADAHDLFRILYQQKTMPGTLS